VNCEPERKITPDYTELVWFQSSPIHGTGGFARNTIPTGARVLEYVGEIVSKSESLRRCADGNECIFALGENHDLDGAVPWNPARFLNHSCSPNCDAVCENGRLWIIANREIPAGEEITFNYNFDLVDYKEHPCHCGAPDCLRYIVAQEFFEHVRRSNMAAAYVTRF
jgi:SET domain-containing protein